MSDIQVVIGTDIKREAVLINPKITPAVNQTTYQENDNVIAHGTTAAELAKRVYGRK